MARYVSKLPEYRHWINMKSRCYTPSSNNFERYGGRGIIVCERWRDSFDNFLTDVGRRPTPLHTLDRIDGAGNYEPSNVRWATKKEQSANIRTNVMVSLRGETVCLSEAARRVGIKSNTVIYRLKRGWTIEQALAREPHKGVRP